jgi:hypothetical protein
MNKFEKTDLILEKINHLIVEIHDLYDGKENLRIRENLMRPVRDLCIRLHYERIDILREQRQSYLRERDDHYH